MNDKIVIIPTYNEIENAENIIRKVMSLQPEFDLLIVDDNSPDNTQEVVRNLQKVYGEDKIKLLARPGKMGLGSAYIDGLKYCTGNFVILMDADLSHHVTQ